MFKIAFLFLTISGICHEQYWHDFFKGHEQKFSVYIHSKEPYPQTQFKRYEMPRKVPTSWANTMHAQVEMLREALKDPNNQRFIFVSQNTIPLQDFDRMYNTLFETDKSIFKYQRNPYADPESPHYMRYPSRVFRFLPPYHQYKNPQWVILNRKHAQMMVDDKHLLPLICAQPSDQEHYPSTFLAHKELLDEVINKETTFIDWREIKIQFPPYVFKNLNDPWEMATMTMAIQLGFFFARKFNKDCNLAPLDKYLDYR